VRYRIGRVLAASTMAATSLFSCGDDDGFPPEPVAIACPAESGKAVTLVVGARANSPAPKLPAEIEGLVREAAKQREKVQVIRVDGEPSVAMTAIFKTNGNNDTIRNGDLTNFVAQVSGLVTQLKPKKPQADVLAALTLAGRSTPKGGTVVLMDSGIPTTGPLSYKNSEMFAAEPEEVTEFLGSEKLLPDLADLSVVLAGVGDTADPQTVLPENYHKQVTSLWTELAEEADAECVHTLGAASGRTAVPTSVPVDLVTLPKPPVFRECGTTVLANSSPVGFVVDEAEFRDPKAAENTLRQLARQVAGQSQEIELTGTTSSEGSVTSNQDLSERRAAAVKKVLIGLGVEGSRITATGAGEQWPGRVRDTTADGTLIPGAAARNRSVVVKLTCDG
jgi:OOP family OmpA-OmpF porin